MSKRNIRKLGSLMVTAVFGIIIVQVFWDRPWIISGLASLVGLGLGMMRAE